MNCIPKYLIEVADIIKADELNSKFDIICDTCKGRNFLIKKEAFKYYQSEWYKKLKDREEELRKEYKHLFDNGAIIGYSGNKMLVAINYQILVSVDMSDIMQKLFETPQQYHYIDAQCEICGKQIVLYDSRKHGYDAFARKFDQGVKPLMFRTDGKLKQKRACTCGQESYKVSMIIDSTGREDLFKETDGLITEDTWTEAFEWITINLECPKCGKIKKSWFSQETM